MEKGADNPKDETALRRLLLFLDGSAAQALRGIDQIVLFFVQADQNVRRWVVSSAAQLRELVEYLNRTYQQEAKKWAGGGNIIVFVGGVSFTVAVGAFDALVFVAEWFFDGKRTREIEKREGMHSV